MRYWYIQLEFTTIVVYYTVPKVGLPGSEREIYICNSELYFQILLHRSSLILHCYQQCMRCLFKITSSMEYVIDLLDFCQHDKWKLSWQVWVLFSVRLNTTFSYVWRLFIFLFLWTVFHVLCPFFYWVVGLDLNFSRALSIYNICLLHELQIFFQDKSKSDERLSCSLWHKIWGSRVHGI